MFFKKTPKPEIDKEQLALIKYAQKRIKQKKRFLYHFTLFCIVALALILFNIGLGFADEFTIQGVHWSILIAVFWGILVFWHAVKTYVLHGFMDKEWEDRQLEHLLIKQKVKIEKLKSSLNKEAVVKAKSELFIETKTAPIKNLTLIVATGENNEIGKDNKLIWHLRDDLKRFKALTSGHFIIMGRKTFESFPKPLPNRTHVVITRQKNYKAPEGVIIVNSIEEALKIAKNDTQPFVIGGGEIYKQALPYASKIELTRVHASFDADTFFPEVNYNQWKEIENKFHAKDDNHDYEFSFLTYMKTNS